MTAGAILEWAVEDPFTGQADGMAMMRVTAAQPPDAFGMFVDGEFLGASSPAKAGLLAGIFMPGPGCAVLHLCSAHGQCAIPAAPRPVVHSKCFRIRTAESLTEPWVRGASPGGGGAGSFGSANPAAAGALNLPAPGAKPEEPPVEDRDKHEKLKKRLRELKRQAEGNDAQVGLFARAQKRQKVNSKKKGKKKKKKKKDLSSSDTSSSSLFHDDPPRQESAGSRIAQLAAAAPGTLLEAGLDEVRKFLVARGGVDEQAAARLAPMMVTYLRTVWATSHKAGEVSMRNSAELEVLAESMDALLSGNLEQLGDLLMQRFKAVQVAGTHGWKLAGELDLSNKGDVTLVSPEEMAAAADARRRALKLEEAVSKASQRDRAAR